MYEINSKKLSAWIRLVRLPNLFTAPGDPLCGFLLAGGIAALEGNSRILTGLVSVCWISFFVYLFGIITNDMADIREDSIYRPNRPLPSGAISSREAFTAAQISFLAAIIPSFFSLKLFFITLILICCVYAYNFYVKSRPLSGSVLMAVCRALSYGLGIVIVPTTNLFNALSAILFGIAIFSYIFGLTEAASFETEHRQKRTGGKYIMLGAFLSFFITGIHTVIFMIRSSSSDFLMKLGGLAAIVCGIYFCLNASGAYHKTMRPTSPKEIQQTVGSLVHAILLMHAAMAGAFGWYMLEVLFILALACAIFSKKMFRVQGS